MQLGLAELWQVSAVGDRASPSAGDGDAPWRRLGVQGRHGAGTRRGLAPNSDVARWSAARTTQRCRPGILSSNWRAARLGKEAGQCFKRQMGRRIDGPCLCLGRLGRGVRGPDGLVPCRLARPRRQPCLVAHSKPNGGRPALLSRVVVGPA
ncbi:hypothetical protein E2562_006794 [Oryza meyeriana var. granulata]|uniref:Uncharacterized protein n=1 Tax=Oryza meyeriana var. granulata TaxID=110450 RepID=A0A6G1C540_9ORYZ|nr:hypothetical protein E2562_006794 [Oryza meyeriana var. granulata]